jgi:hypothetical protein
MTFEKFHWTSPEGVEISLPRMDKIKAGIIRRHRKEEPTDFIFSVLEETADAETLAKVDDLDTTDLNTLVEKWQAGASVGESAGSST